MAFEYLLLIVATLLFNPGYSLKCSIRINKTSPDVTEKNVSEIVFFKNILIVIIKIFNSSF